MKLNGFRKNLASLVLAGTMALGLAGKANASTIDLNNPSNWTESSGKYENLPFPITHGVQDGRYVTYNSANSSGGEANLTLARKFVSGDELNCDVEVNPAFVVGANDVLQGSFMNIYANDNLLGWIGTKIYNGRFDLGDLGYSGSEKFNLDFKFSDNRLDFKSDGIVEAYGNTYHEVVSKSFDINEPYTITLNTSHGLYGSGSSSAGNFTLTPEPSALPLLALGAGALAFSRRRNGPTRN
jgi:hypothetical protein